MRAQIHNELGKFIEGLIEGLNNPSERYSRYDAGLSGSFLEFIENASPSQKQFISFLCKELNEIEVIPSERKYHLLEVSVAVAKWQTRETGLPLMCSSYHCEKTKMYANEEGLLQCPNCGKTDANIPSIVLRSYRESREAEDEMLPV